MINKSVRCVLHVCGDAKKQEPRLPNPAHLDEAGVNVWPLVTAPVALAIDGVLGNGPASFPDVPTAWSEAARAYGQRAAIPEGIFELVFP